VTGTLTASGQAAGAAGRLSMGPFSAYGTADIESEQQITLVAGVDNIVLVPSGATAAMVGLYYGTADSTLRTNLNSGDVGLPITSVGTPAPSEGVTNPVGLPVTYLLPTGVTELLIKCPSAGGQAYVAFV
jgi:hypothetical protein